ncbi:hypothetical protein HJC23_004500, partial [Cyclotella cryptica]
IHGKMSSPILFVIVGKNEPLFEAEIDTHSGAQGNDLSTRQNYFVLHSALDLVEKSAWTTTNMYLKVVDKVNHQQVSTFLTAGNIKFMLLHGGKGEEVIKSFFNDVYGYYVKVRCIPNLNVLVHLSSKELTNLVSHDNKAVNESIL